MFVVFVVFVVASMLLPKGVVTDSVGINKEASDTDEVAGMAEVVGTDDDTVTGKDDIIDGTDNIIDGTDDITDGNVDVSDTDDEWTDDIRTEDVEPLVILIPVITV